MSAGRLSTLPTRAWVLAGAVSALVIAAAAWLVVISPVRSDASQLRDDTASVQTQNITLMARNNKLRDLASHKQQLVTELQAALNGLPSGPSLPVFSRQLAAQAADRGVVLTGVSIGTPVSPTATTGGTTTTDPATTDPATTATTATAGSGTADTATAPLAIPITITSTGSALQQLMFMRDIEQIGPRLALVTSAALAPGQGADEGGSIADASTLTLQLTVFTNPLPKTTRQQLTSVSGTLAATDGD